MKKLIWFTVIMCLSQGLMILSQLLSDKGNNWTLMFAVLLIIAILIHFFVEYNKLNKLK